MAKILVVDDVRFISEMLADILQREGHVVDTAANGDEALAKVNVAHPDLILLDIAMPGMDGLDVARTLKGEPTTRHIPIMIVSSRHDDQTIASARECGVEDYMTKPFETEALLAKTAQLLGGHRMNFSVEVENAIPVVTVLQPEITGEVIEQLGEALETARGGGARPMVLDMSRVAKAAPGVPEIINSFGVKIHAAGGRLEVVLPGRGIGTAAIASKADSRIGNHSRREEAIAAARANCSTATMKRPPKSSVRVEMRGDTVFVQVLRSDLRGDAFRRLERAIVKSQHDAMLELSGVMEMTSSDVSRLHTILQKVETSGRNLRIVNPEPQILDDLRAGGLDRILFRTKDATTSS